MRIQLHPLNLNVIKKLNVSGINIEIDNSYKLFQKYPHWYDVRYRLKEKLNSKIIKYEI